MSKILIEFSSEKLKQDLLSLKDGDDSDKQLYRFVLRAFDDITLNLFCSTKIPKKLWPKDYKKYELTNLWKYDLPNGWRLIFTLEKEELIVVAIILEWFSHKDYERRFKY